MTTDTTRMRGSRVPPLLRTWGVAIALVALSLLSGYANVANHDEQFSPYDEWVYYDYLTKVPEQGFVRQGEEIGPVALEAMACHGDRFGPRGEPCTGESGTYDEPDLYPQQGITSADAYTPLYFASTWVVAQAIQLISGADLLTAGRAVGPLWLAGGVWFTVLLMRRFGVPQSMQLGLGMLLIGTPTIQFANTFISTDAPLLLFGAAILWLGVRFAQTGRGASWLIAASVLGTLTKITTIVAVGTVVVALILRWVLRRPIESATRVRYLAVPIVAAVASLTAQVGWLAFRASQSLGPGADQGLATSLTPQGLASSAFVFLAATGVPPDAGWVDIVNGPLRVLLLVGVVGWFLVERGRSDDRAWSLAAGIAAFMFAPALLVGISIAQGGEVAPITPRYALPIYPLFMVAIAAITRNAIARWSVFGYGAAMFVVGTAGLNP